MNESQSRRETTIKRIAQLRVKLLGAEERAKGKACVYATGSFGRCEASEHSDLDLFIVGKDAPEELPGENNWKSQLRRLDEICVKAELIQATRELKIPEFSGDGEYLIHYSVSQLIKTLGTRNDDVANTFTARLLLLLESKPLVGDVVYEEIISEVISAYWRDYADHKNDFIPAFLTNDILRLWRTLCVNYEAATDREPEDRKIKGKIKNYKLKHSRMLTCYSAILYLLGVYREYGTVSPDNALGMIKLTPTLRLESIARNVKLQDAHAAVRSLLRKYDDFLTTTDAKEEELQSRFRLSGSKYLQEAYEFGDSVAKALSAIGKNNASRFYRLLVV